MPESNIYQKLVEIQSELKAPKSQYNSFGKYNYRNCEDILEALKPLLKKYGLFLLISDEIIFKGDRYYVMASVTLSDGATNIITNALARESEDKKGMDDSQITGAASSYARKYALNGMFCIDDSKDADSDSKTTEKIATPKEKPMQNKETPKTENLEYITKDQKDELKAKIGASEFAKIMNANGGKLLVKVYESLMNMKEVA